ncbi:hypothetical protein TcasGA2_TC033979 [Tribolium castaneum]|uniref:Uncharacterized protein n=1 Tax=Tribolium castaneum TaxID=7070 RepID=A0A139WDS5_TRICA|nr:PREDICTED: uncharacterized protein LOC103313797 [Tribolium castaneum]KYB26118.1 hypothetical protein TcasGA2_TC033979 [Tribolium castaneum]|eukprot:XP_008196200.1 PREDICTED: uncharacterized protein LOC103313797 [Tribolium castaneum]
MDDASRRREARRRKILENSQNRLNRITGIEQKSPTKLPELQSHDFEADNSPSCVSNNVNIGEVKPRTEVKPPKQYRAVVLAALAFFVNFLLLLDALVLKLDPKSTHFNKIFVPFLLYEATQFFTSRNARSDKSFVYLLLIAKIANAKNNHLVTVIKQLELVASIVQDLMIYFFVFVCCHYFRFVLVPS